MPRYPTAQWPLEVGSVETRLRALVIGASAWKHFVPYFLPEFRVKRISSRPGHLRFLTLTLPKLVYRKDTRLFVWGLKEPPCLQYYAKWLDRPVTRTEDGFLRSVALGAKHVIPLSLSVDMRGIYFDPTSPLDRKHILITHDFEADPKSSAWVSPNGKFFPGSRSNKHNDGSAINITRIYRSKNRKRVLLLCRIKGNTPIARGYRVFRPTYEASAISES